MTKQFSYPDTGLVIPEYADKSDKWLVDYGISAAEAGFGSIWCGEGWGYNPFQLLARIGTETDCPLGTSIANVSARSPAALAANALALSHQTDGQFVLGIGTSTPAVVEQFHGANFESPLRRIRETIEIVDLALAGERINYDGRVFSLSGFHLNHADDDQVPILNAALGRTNIALSIDHADGILPHFLPISSISDAIEAGKKRAHTERELRVVPSTPASIHEDGEVARSVLSEHIAYYTGSTTYYNDVIADNGFKSEATEIQNQWDEGNQKAAAGAVSDELLDAIGLAGTPATVKQRFEQLRANEEIDTVLVSFPHGASEEMYDLTLEVLPS